MPALNLSLNTGPLYSTFSSWKFYVCYRYYNTSDLSLLSAILNLPFLSVSVWASWKYLFKIKVISLKDTRATLHRLLFYEFSERILPVWNTGHFHGNRLHWRRAKLILSVSLPSMNFLLPFCHQWSRQPWKVIINRLWQPQPLSAATSTWRGGNYKLFITDEVKKQVNPHTAEHICMSAHV